MEKQKVTIFRIEQKTTKNKKSYWVAETGLGKFSIWDIRLYEILKEKAIGKEVEIGIESKEANGKTFYNIVSLEAVLGEGKTEEKQPTIADSAKLRRRTDCLICAKDLVIAKEIPLDNLLIKASELVDWVEK